MPGPFSVPVVAYTGISPSMKVEADESKPLAEREG
jgi:hypothetical protein